MPSKLDLYNGALIHLGERTLATLEENRRARRVLDRVYAKTLKAAIEEGPWAWARRTARLDYDPSLTSQFGYRYGFMKPSDLRRLIGIATDEFLRSPLTDYADEGDHWMAEFEAIYVHYVSDDALYGGDLSRWPGKAQLYLEAKLAEAAAQDLRESKVDDMRKLARSLLSDATNLDAIGQAPRFKPEGRWLQARRGGRGRSIQRA